MQIHRIYFEFFDVKGEWKRGVNCSSNNKTAVEKEHSKGKREGNKNISIHQPIQGDAEELIKLYLIT